MSDIDEVWSNDWSEEWSEVRAVVLFLKAVTEDRLVLYALIIYICFRLVCFCKNFCCCDGPPPYRSSTPSSDTEPKGVDPIKGAGNQTTEDPHLATPTPYQAIIGPCPETVLITMDPNQDGSAKNQQSPRHYTPLCVYGTLSRGDNPV